MPRSPGPQRGQNIELGQTTPKLKNLPTLHADPPKGTTHMIFRHQMFLVDRQQWDEKQFGSWYTPTWLHFASFTPSSGGARVVRFDIAPMDTDLERWLTDSGLKHEKMMTAAKDCPFQK
jgi:hypothetical protein